MDNSTSIVLSIERMLLWTIARKISEDRLFFTLDVFHTPCSDAAVDDKFSLRAIVDPGSPKPGYRGLRCLVLGTMRAHSGTFIPHPRSVDSRGIEDEVFTFDGVRLS